MMGTYAVLDANGVVVNVIVWDGDTEQWQPPEGHTVVEVPEGVFCSIGHIHNAGQFDAPPVA